MPAQKRETGKNYIGLLSDEIDAAARRRRRPATDRRMKAYVLGLMAADGGRVQRRSEAS